MVVNIGSSVKKIILGEAVSLTVQHFQASMNLEFCPRVICFNDTLAHRVETIWQQLLNQRNLPLIDSIQERVYAICHSACEALEIGLVALVW